MGNKIIKRDEKCTLITLKTVKSFKIKIKISRRDQDTAGSCVIFMLENLTALSVNNVKNRYKVFPINREKSGKKYI